MIPARCLTALRPLPFVVALLLCTLSSRTVTARTFEAEGTDTGMGVGPRYVALGGSGVALADDVYAAYHNPAGLAAIDKLQVTVARQVSARLSAVSFLGVAAPLPLPLDWDYRAALAVVYYPRIHARASGAFADDELASVFLRYLLPGIAGTFDGEIDSKTKVYRLAIGLAPREPRWSLGLNLDLIDCQTYFCGVHATSNGYTVSSGGAMARSYGFGFKYRPHATWLLAGAVSDVNTRLHVDTTTTDAAGTRQERFQVAFPRRVVLGFSVQATPATQLTASYERTEGDYGDNHVDLQIVRLGTEMRQHATLRWRLGAVIPVRMRSTLAPDIALPFPFAPTLGLGWHRPRWQLDVAVYVHPLMSAYRNRPVTEADLSFTLAF